MTFYNSMKLSQNVCKLRSDVFITYMLFTHTSM